MKRVGLYCNLFWLFLSLLICIESYRLKLGTFKVPGPGFFPFGAALLMLILSLISLFHSSRKPHDASMDAGQGPFRWWSIVTILLAVPAYALSLETIGFFINSFLFITLLLKVVEPQTWKTAILWGIITAAAADLVFNVVFRAQIPSGIIGF